MNAHHSDSPGEEPKTGHDVESPSNGEQGEFNLADRSDQLERGLKSRHIQFLALGKLHSLCTWAHIANRDTQVVPLEPVSSLGLVRFSQRQVPRRSSWAISA